MKMHYAGVIIWRGGNVLPGWAACCTGDKAVAIRDRGNHVWNRDEVTCKGCLKMIKKHDDFAPEYARIVASR